MHHNHQQALNDCELIFCHIITFKKIQDEAKDTFQFTLI